MFRLWFYKKKLRRALIALIKSSSHTWSVKDYKNIIPNGPGLAIAKTVVILLKVRVGKTSFSTTSPLDVLARVLQRVGDDRATRILHRIANDCLRRGFIQVRLIDENMFFKTYRVTAG